MISAIKGIREIERRVGHSGGESRKERKACVLGFSFDQKQKRKTKVFLFVWVFWEERFGKRSVKRKGVLRAVDWCKRRDCIFLGSYLFKRRGAGLGVSYFCIFFLHDPSLLKVAHACYVHSFIVSSMEMPWAYESVGFLFFKAWYIW